MSDQAQNSSPVKAFFVAAAIFLSFGFVILILSGAAGHGSVEEKAYEGEFDSATVEARWKNLEDVTAAQQGMVDAKKVDAALASLSKSSPKAAKSGVVVPGSPTFLKQMEEEAAKAAAAEEAKKKAEAEKKPEAPAKTEEGAAKPAPAPEAKKEEPAKEAAPAPKQG